MKSTLARLGAQPRGRTPQDLADHMANETKKWKPIVESIGLKVN
jgi:tripartite-type tricarboxylate transporter receptor subunit TctC